MGSKAWPWLHTTLSVPCSINVNSECCTVEILGKDSLEKAALASFFQHMYIYKYIYIYIFGNANQLCYIVLEKSNWTVWVFSVEFQTCMAPAFGEKCTDGNYGYRLFMNKESFTDV